MSIDQIDPQKLVDARKKLGITQATLASALKISQSQVSLFEKSPSEASFRLLTQWAQLLALRLDDLRTETGDYTGIPWADTYARMRDELGGLRKLAKGASPETGRPSVSGIAAAADSKSSPAVLMEIVDRYLEPPVLAVAGKFDSGKSSLLTHLLGLPPDGGLPVGVGEMTLSLTFIRHECQRPAWTQEQDELAFRTASCFVLSPAFDPRRWREKDHFKDNIVDLGGFDVIRDHATRKGKVGRPGRTALVFLDAPVLRLATLVDTPGSGIEDSGASRILEFIDVIDLLVFTSTSLGFLDSSELGFLMRFIGPLANRDPSCAADVPSNLMIVATRADPRSVSDSDMNEVLDKASLRLARSLALLGRRGQSSDDLEQMQGAVRQRFHTFFRESPERRARFEAELRRLLEVDFQKHWVSSAKRQLLVLESNQPVMKQWVALRERVQEARKQLAAVRRAQPTRDKVLANHSAAIRERLERLAKQASEIVYAEKDEALATDTLTDFIRERKYASTDDAKQSAQRELQLYVWARSVERIRKEFHERVSELITDLLGQFPFNIDTSVGSDAAVDAPVDIPRNTFAYVLGGLAAAGGMAGAFLFGQAGMPAIAAWPAAVAVAGAGGFTGFSIVSTDWERRLASRLQRVLENDPVWGRLGAALRSEVQGGQRVFDESLKLVLSRWHNFVRTLELIDDPHRKQDLESLLARMDEDADFFKQIKDFAVEQ